MDRSPKVINLYIMILTSATPNALIMEGNEIVNGWPLGLGNMSSVVGSTSQAAAANISASRRSSFSSFSSSNLDTESTASFFPDQSVPLGRLIGIRTIGGKKQMQSENVGEAEEGSRHGPHPHGGAQARICTGLLQHVIARIFRRPKHLHLHTLLCCFLTN